MPFQISVNLGLFAIAHDDDADTAEAMHNGTYEKALGAITGKFTQVVESGVLDEFTLDDADLEDLLLDGEAPA